MIAGQHFYYAVQNVYIFVFDLPSLQLKYITELIGAEIKKKEERNRQWYVSLTITTTAAKNPWSDP